MSGLAAPSAAATLRSTSMLVTRNPCRCSASAQALPERSDTSRSADHPPIRTATCLVISLHPDPLDLPRELHAARLAHAAAHLFAESLDISRGRLPAVDQEVAVHLRYLRIAHDEPAAD